MLSHSSLLTINSLLQQKHTFLMNRNSQSLSRLFWCLNSLSLFRFWFDIFSTHNTNKFISIFPQFLSKFIRASIPSPFTLITQSFCKQSWSTKNEELNYNQLIPTCAILFVFVMKFNKSFRGYNAYKIVKTNFSYSYQNDFHKRL